MTGLIFVGFGGAIGAMLRYGIGLIPYKQTFPLLTFITNILGALLIGFIVGTAARKGMRPNALLFWKTGVCGGFTTFSTFSLEAYMLMQEKRYCWGVAYMTLSVGVCIIGIMAGMYLAKRAWS